MSTVLAVRGIEKTTDGFRWKLARVADALQVNVDWLATVISFETDGTFDPTILNKAGSGAVGLIQFLPSTARLLGTSAAALARMSAEEQLDWVYAYLRRYKGRMTSLPAVYLAVLQPSALGKPLDEVLFRRGEDAYALNSTFDRTGKGYVTVGDVVSVIWAVQSYGMQRGRVPVPRSPPSSFTLPLPPAQRLGHSSGHSWSSCS